ncbi:hypothetical protein ABIA09_007314 [Bradyrhizobium yuanmingense]
MSSRRLTPVVIAVAPNSPVVTSIWFGVWTT